MILLYSIIIITINAVHMISLWQRKSTMSITHPHESTALNLRNELDRLTLNESLHPQLAKIFNVR